MNELIIKGTDLYLNGKKLEDVLEYTLSANGMADISKAETHLLDIQTVVKVKDSQDQKMDNDCPTRD